MRRFARYFGLLAVPALIVVLSGCASTVHPVAPQSASVQPLGVASPTVNVGSPDTPFPQNKQNEPAVAIDPNNPSLLAAGANDELDLAPCSGSSCPFTQGVGLSGIYFSTDGGASWTQPTYQGWSARGGTPGVGPIGTLPNYYEAGLVSDGDPTLAFGPKPGANGTFSWSNGTRLYYGNLTSNFGSTRKGSAFKGFEAIAVSHTDSLSSAIAGDNSAWSAPVIVSKQNAALFSDKDALWVDNNAHSPYFGHVYMCNVAFRGQELSPYSAPEPVIFSRSSDGGQTWTNLQISSAANNLIGQGRQGCAVRTDSHGVIYVFFESATHKKTNPPVAQSAILMSRSTNGGVSFTPPRAIATVTDCGQLDALGNVALDGIAGARTNSFPSVDIANGAPDASNAPNTIAVTWCDASQVASGGNEQALVTLSTNGGRSWSTPVSASAASDRPDFPSIAISPDGSQLYVTYMSFEQPYQTTEIKPRTMQGVVRTASVAAPGTWTAVYTGPSGDARTSSANSLTAEFLGDYTYTAATNGGVVSVWTGATGADCPAVDSYRASLFTSSPSAAPAPATDCPTTFGDTDIQSYSSITTP